MSRLFQEFMSSHPAHCSRHAFVPAKVRDSRTREANTRGCELPIVVVVAVVVAGVVVVSSSS